jgi:hypothetical protein
MTTDLVNVMRHELPDFCRLKTSVRQPHKRDNLLMTNEILFGTGPKGVMLCVTFMTRLP